MKRTVLMSIKPRYVKEILNGTKHFEFRRVVFDHDNVDRVIIYASSPMKRVVAEFNVDRIISDLPSKVWEECQNFAGIDEKSFMEYFSNKSKAFSIVIKDLTIYREPINPYESINDFRPPQSYMYLDKRLESVLKGILSA